jgi:hypothetical protein
MSTHRIAAAVTAVLAVVVLSPAAAAAKVAPVPGDGPVPRNTQQSDTRAGPPSRTIAASLDVGAPLSTRAAEQAADYLDDVYSGYPGGAGGSSNGELTAGQKGEPLGAGGTSAGSASRFARAGAPAPTVARVSAFTRLLDEYRQVPSLAERRLLHNDLILVRRDGS